MVRFLRCGDVRRPSSLIGSDWKDSGYTWLGGSYLPLLGGTYLPLLRNVAKVKAEKSGMSESSSRPVRTPTNGSREIRAFSRINVRSVAMLGMSESPAWLTFRRFIIVSLLNVALCIVYVSGDSSMYFENSKETIFFLNIIILYLLVVSSRTPPERFSWVGLQRLDSGVSFKHNSA